MLLTITATDATSPTYLTAWPGGPRPNASNLNPTGPDPVANLTAVPISADGTISVFNFAGTTNVAIEVVGWY